MGHSGRATPAPSPCASSPCPSCWWRRQRRGAAGGARRDRARRRRRSRTRRPRSSLGAQVKPGRHAQRHARRPDRDREALYRAGSVDKLLLSGDHGPLELRRGRERCGARCSRDGIPGAGPVHRPRRLRHVGQRAAGAARVRRRLGDRRRPSGSTSRARCSPRAARGCTSTGFAADRRDYGRVMGRLQLREALARVKVVADALTGASRASSGRGCRSAATAARPGARRPD